MEKSDASAASEPQRRIKDQNSLWPNEREDVLDHAHKLLEAHKKLQTEKLKKKRIAHEQTLSKSRDSLKEIITKAKARPPPTVPKSLPLTPEIRKLCRRLHRTALEARADRSLLDNEDYNQEILDQGEAITRAMSRRDRFLTQATLWAPETDAMEEPFEGYTAEDLNNIFEVEEDEADLEREEDAQSDGEAAIETLMPVTVDPVLWRFERENEQSAMQE